MMRHLLYFLVAGWTLLVAPAAAGDRPVVVELYTSQGCPTCPPANDFFTQLAARDDVVALSLHVDYWDYMGWADPFALAEHTSRQLDYAPRTARKRLFTPLVVVGGLDMSEGYAPMKVVDLIETHRALESGVTVELRRDGSRLRIEARSEAALAAPAMVVLVRFRPEATIEIKAGENAGQTMTYTNVVTSWARLGAWDGRLPFVAAAETPPSGQSEAVIVQSGGHGLILAAARLR